MYSLTLKVFLFFSFAILTTPAVAENFCDFQSVVSAYNSALNREKIDDREGAHRRFMPLAKMGLAPAQRHVAKFYLEESRDDQAIEKAAMWTRLATWGGDLDAQKMLERQSATMRDDRLATSNQWARAWKPVNSECEISENTDDLIFAGHIPIVKDEAISEENYIRFSNRLGEALFISDQVAQKFYPLINLIPMLEVKPSFKSERFLGFDEDRERFLVSLGFMEDQTQRQLSYSMVLAVQRALFEKLEDATFNDPLARQVGKMKLYGSVYGDVNTQRYLQFVQKALLETRKLPSILYDVVFALDEILYMPPSKFHRSRLDREENFVRYDVEKSINGKRVGVIQHKISFEDEETILMHLIRLGTFSQYHSRIEGMKNRQEGPIREQQLLKALEGDAQAISTLFNSRVKKEDAILEEWRTKGPEGLPELQCLAADNQVKAAIRLEIAPTKFARIVNLKGCNKARSRWQKYLNE